MTEDSDSGSFVKDLMTPTSINRPSNQFDNRSASQQAKPVIGNGNIFKTSQGANANPPPNGTEYDSLDGGFQTYMDNIPKSSIAKTPNAVILGPESQQRNLYNQTRLNGTGELKVEEVSTGNLVPIEQNVKRSAKKAIFETPTEALNENKGTPEP